MINKTESFKIRLRRGQDGQFRPNLPDPQTADEAKAYGEAAKKAEAANDFFQSVTNDAHKLMALDGSAKDLNSKNGVVVTSEPNASGKGADSSVVVFNDYSDDIHRYERKVDGVVGKWEVTQTTTYATGPLLMEYKREGDMVGHRKGSFVDNEHKILKDLGLGYFDYTQEVDLLKPEEGEKAGFWGGFGT